MDFLPNCFLLWCLLLEFHWRNSCTKKKKLISDIQIYTSKIVSYFLYQQSLHPFPPSYPCARSLGADSLPQLPFHSRTSKRLGLLSGCRLHIIVTWSFSIPAGTEVNGIFCSLSFLVRCLRRTIPSGSSPPAKSYLPFGGVGSANSSSHQSMCSLLWYFAFLLSGYCVFHEC
jgi:hypothetical protein